MSTRFTRLLDLLLLLVLQSLCLAGELVRIPGVESPQEVDGGLGSHSAWTSLPGQLLVYLDRSDAGIPNGAIRLGKTPIENIHVLASKGPPPLKLIGEDMVALYRDGRYLFVTAPPHRIARLKTRVDHNVAIIPFPRNQPLVGRFSISLLTPDESRDEYCDQVSSDRIRATMETLVACKTRYTFSEGYQAAAAFCHETLQSLGLTTRYETFSSWGRDGKNVIAELPGIADSGDIYIFCGHLDSTSYDAAEFAPGADDNASGSAGVLEAARILSAHTPRHSIWFVLFGGEEQGLYGSKALVKGLKSRNELDRVKGVFNLDMISYSKGPKLKVMLETKELASTFMNVIAEEAAAHTGLEVHHTFHAWGSDHIPFLNEGIPSVLTYEFDYDDNPNEHTPRDIMDHVNIELAVEILKADLAAAIRLAGPLK